MNTDEMRSLINSDSDRCRADAPADVVLDLLDTIDILNGIIAALESRNG